jgi:hypothetical protein
MMPAARPFITEVVRLFNRQHYPTFKKEAPNFSLLKLPSSTFNNEQENRLRVGHLRLHKKINDLIPELRDLVAENTADIGHWLDIHGIFGLSQALQMDEKAINYSSKKKLLEFAQPISPLRSAKLQLLSYIFTDAFAQASETEKENLIGLAQTLQPRLETSYSTFKKISIKISSFSSKILGSPIVVAGTSIFAAYKATIIYAAVKPLFSYFVWQKAIPFVVIPLINYGSLKVIKVVSITIGAVDWVIHHQLRFWFVNLGVSRIPHARIRELGKRILNVLLFPTSLSTRISWLPYTIAMKTWSVSYRSQQAIAASLIAMTDRVKALHLEIEGNKALRIWLDLSQMRAISA